MHPVSESGHSRRLVSSIAHKPTLEGFRELLAASRGMVVNTTCCVSAWICALVDAESPRHLVVLVDNLSTRLISLRSVGTLKIKENLLRSRNYSLTSLLAVLVLAASLLAGCGASDQSASDQSKSGSESDSGQAKQEENKKSEAEKKGEDGEQAERKIALGTVVAVNAETNKFSLKPSDPEAGDKPMKFRLGKGAKIMANGEKAEFSEMKKDQQIKVKYVVKKDKNRARVVELLGGGKTGGETTG